MPKEQKFNFKKYRPYDLRATQESKMPTASIIKPGLLYVTKETIKKYNWDKSYFRMFYDESKRVIGWEVKDKVDMLDYVRGNKSEWKKLNKSNALSIVSLVKHMNVNFKKNKKLEIETYEVKDPNIVGYNNSRKIYYIQLK